MTLATPKCALAQITPDATLLNNSTVKLEGNTRIIEEGTKAGTNLFHSFGEFSVPTGSTAFFNNGADIQNIISRVTGSSISNIDGSIKANGVANLFFINPNGIIFGQNARLDIGGSFIASTASSLKFADGTDFSAKIPKTSSLLTISVPIGLQFGTNAGDISVQGVSGSVSNAQGQGLRVSPTKTLALVGGNINLEGAFLNAPGGRIELGSVTGDSLVNLNPTPQGWTLNYQSIENFGNIKLKKSFVDIAIEPDSSIQMPSEDSAINIQSELLDLRNSTVTANTFTSAPAGDMNIDVQELTMWEGAILSTRARTGSTGEGGDLTIKTNTLLVQDGSQISASTFGAGNGGNLTVDAFDMQLIGRSADGQLPSALGASANSNSTGNAGDLTIKTNTLVIRDGAQVAASTSGVGKGGNLTVDAFDVHLIGRSSRLDTSSTQRNSTGNAGNLTIKTNTLVIRDGAQVSASTFGAGNGGNLTVDAFDVKLIGTIANGRVSSGLATSTQPNSTGNAGNLTIKTNTLLVQGGAQVTASTFGSGKGGNLTVDALDVQLIGRSTDIQFPSSLSASSQPNATSNAGNLTVKTKTLVVRDGAQILTGTFGAGKGGNLTVDAFDVQLIGRSADGQFSSALGTATQVNSTGDAGNLTVKTKTLVVRDGAQILTGTSGAGKGGNLTVDAFDVQLIGRSADRKSVSGFFASAQQNSTGNAGGLTIKTNTLLVQDGARVSVQSSGAGTAGNITVNARSIRLDNNALLSANTRSIKVEPNSEQATININSPLLIMSRNSNLITNATGENVTGGNINIDTDFLVAYQNSDISANSANFRGGNVRINAQGIFGIQFRDVLSDRTSDITATGVSREFSGNVEIITPDVDPSRGLSELPTNLVDASGQIDTACAPGSRRRASSFIITGRGGLPLSPTEPLQDSATLAQWVRPRTKPNNSSKTQVSNTPQVSPAAVIVEANGWLVNTNGDILLVAQVPHVNPSSSWHTATSCTAPH
ncbi:S-layer family protein [Calothrix sp. NIES-2098]|uniref:S-layer family protein n=1 Tax=Calothrix sp. NIES-2098 TaxID=1954171 RepID=UPI0030D7B6AC